MFNFWTATGPVVMDGPASKKEDTLTGEHGG